MQQRHQRRPSPGRRRKQGFSRPVSRRWFDMLGIRRDQSHEFFNFMSKSVVCSLALTAGIFGLMEPGWIAGLVLAGLGAWFVKRDGMFR